jgi:hypothetical protein
MRGFKDDLNHFSCKLDDSYSKLETKIDSLNDEREDHERRIGRLEDPPVSKVASNWIRVGELAKWAILIYLVINSLSGQPKQEDHLTKTTEVLKQMIQP